MTAPLKNHLRLKGNCRSLNKGTISKVHRTKSTFICLLQSLESSLFILGRRGCKGCQGRKGRWSRKGRWGREGRWGRMVRDCLDLSDVVVKVTRAAENPVNNIV